MTPASLLFGVSLQEEQHREEGRAMAKSYFHVSRVQIEDLIAEKLPPGERQRVVSHLLSGCKPCAELVRAAICPGDEEPDYTAIIRRLELAYVVAQNDVHVERRNADALWPKLQNQSPERRLFIIKNIDGYRTWGMYERVVEQTKTTARNDPLQAVDLAHLALAITELLDVEAYGQERIYDFQAGAYTALGNAKRLVGDFAGAEAALKAAHELLDKGTGDPHEKAYLVSIYSSLKADLGYLEDATELLSRGIKYAISVNDRQLQGRLVLKQSSFIGFVDPILGLEMAEQGMSLLEQGKDPHLDLVGRHLLAFWNNELGNPEEAASILATYRYMYDAFGDAFWAGRLLHLQANIARTEGDLRKAEHFFRDAVELYAEHNFEFDLVLASLDLAEVLALQSRLVESGEILAHLYPVLEAWKLHGDILRSWKILQEGTERRNVQASAFRELAMTLRRKWYRRA
jgi:tetratricopeptide (TPR) repeat protein